MGLMVVILYGRMDMLKNLLPEPKALDRYAYRSIMVAFPIMTLVIVTGAIWANQAWGRYWGWDPKETASLITWIIYLLYLHSRITHGWTGRRTAYISIIGFVSVVFTYLGVNLLMSGLHAYATG
jgi:cytochrome c-type biogenesis protein CcsB